MLRKWDQNDSLLQEMAVMGRLLQAVIRGWAKRNERMNALLVASEYFPGDRWTGSDTNLSSMCIHVENINYTRKNDQFKAPQGIHRLHKLENVRQRRQVSSGSVLKGYFKLRFGTLNVSSQLATLLSSLLFNNIFFLLLFKALMMETLTTPRRMKD